MTRHLVAIYNPKDGSHRIAGNILPPGETIARVSVAPKDVPLLLAALKPKAGEAAIVLDVPGDEPAPPPPPPPRPTLRSV